MPSFKLTFDAVEALAVDGKDRLHFDDIVSGFGVRVTPAGSKIFVAQRRLGGKPVRVSLGMHPEMSVTKARAAARDALNKMGGGVDPRQEAKQPVKVDEDGFDQVVDRWLAEHVRPKLKPLTIRDYEKIADELKARFEGRAFAAITKDDARKLHAEKAETPRRANYVLQVLSAILAYGDRPSLTAGIKRYREGVKERILTAAEMERVFNAIAKLEAEKKLSPHACGALKFAISTGARPAEIRSIEWNFLDHERKRVVLPDSKANRPRVLYCSTLAWSVLTAMPRFGRFVFAGETKNTAYQNLTRAWIKVRKEAKVSDVRLYDCRHSFASQAALAGHNLPMIGALLGHSVPATTARYVHLVGDPAAAAAQDVGDRIAAALANGAEKKGATPLAKRRVAK